MANEYYKVTVLALINEFLGYEPDKYSYENENRRDTFENKNTKDKNIICNNCLLVCYSQLEGRCAMYTHSPHVIIYNVMSLIHYTAIRRLNCNN